jgi:pilus assembly protein Flp/PilA
MQFINNGILEIVSRIQNRNEEGASMAEYGLLVALIAVAAIATLTTLGTDIAGKFEEVSTALAG